jgi:hypothetical protein
MHPVLLSINTNSTTAKAACFNFIHPNTLNILNPDGPTYSSNPKPIRPTLVAP